jgi:hypothetical protein
MVLFHILSADIFLGKYVFPLIRSFFKLEEIGPMHSSLENGPLLFQGNVEERVAEILHCVATDR